VTHSFETKGEFQAKAEGRAARGTRFENIVARASVVEDARGSDCGKWRNGWDGAV